MFRLLDKFINWLIYTSIFAAACAVGLCMATEKLLIGHIPPFSVLHLFIFGSTVLVYNIHFLFKRGVAGEEDRYGWAYYYKLWHTMGILTALVCIPYSLYFLPAKIWIACVVLGVLSFTYSLPLLPFKRKRRLKDYGWVKLFTLVSVWTIVTAVLPMLYWDTPLQCYPYEIAIRFVFMMALCIAFDIRDMQSDKEASIYTLPNSIGEQWSYRLINISLVVFLLLGIVQHLRYPSVPRLMADGGTAIASYFSIRYALRHPTDKIFLLLVDGMMLFYAVLVLLLQVG